MSTQLDGEVSGYTQCPSCLTVFGVAPSELNASEGRARCGLCGREFDAALLWRPDLPSPISPRPQAPPQTLEPAGRRQRGSLLSTRPGAAASDESSSRDHQPASAPRRLPASEAGAPVGPDERAPARPGGSGLPVEEGQDDGWRVVTGAELDAAPRRRWPWLALALVLSLMLVGQLAWFHRHRLAAVATLRPAVTSMCEPLPCGLAPRRRPEAIDTIERQVTRTSSREEAMALTAVIANRADEPQPWPQLGLRLSALNGDILASHWFAPADYRRRSDQRLDYMAPGARYRVRVLFRQPGREVAGFELDFR